MLNAVMLILLRSVQDEANYHNTSCLPPPKICFVFLKPSATLAPIYCGHTNFLMYFRKSRFYFYAKSLPLNAKALKVIGEQQLATPENEIHLICFCFLCGLIKNISHF